MAELETSELEETYSHGYSNNKTYQGHLKTRNKTHVVN